MCEEDETTLTGFGAVSYQWTSNSGVFIGSPIPVSPNSTITYTLIGTDANGCSNTTTYELNVTSCVGLKNVTKTASGISVYPNPNNGAFTVEVVKGSLHSVELTDVTGRLILAKNSVDSKVSFDLSNYSNGIYYVKVSTPNTSEVIKIVKQ